MINRNRASILCALLVVTSQSDAANLIAPDVYAAQIARAGDAQGTPACATCHGANGEGNPLMGAPRLSGLPAGYAVRQLNHFADNEHANAMMMAVAKTLSSGQRTALATYYSHLQTPVDVSSPAASTSSKSVTSMGSELSLRGRWSDNLPACIQCHGMGGVGVGDAFPPLAGQSALYLANQLRAWQNGTRDPGPQALMRGIVKKLSPADIEAVATYFSEQPVQTVKRHP